MPATRRRTTTKLLRLYPEELAGITLPALVCSGTPARVLHETARKRGGEAERAT